MYMNDCNEYNTGTNSAVCSELDSTTTESISIDAENNKVTSDNHVNQIQNCDESISGDNNAKCTNSSANFFDSIDVSNNNNKINYDINTKTNKCCNDKRNGNNNVECENILKTQVNNLSLGGDKYPN